MTALTPELDQFIRAIPKAELHLHIEGSLEPEMVFELARKHGVKLAYPSVEALRAAYDFSDLQSFLDIYYAGASVLIDEQDFYDLTYAYMQRAHADGVVHAEIMFDPQTHTARGVAFETVITGIDRALADARIDFGMTSKLIMSFLRHLNEDEAFATWEQAQPFLSKIAAVGLDSSERGHPPSKFSRVFAKVREAGLKVVAHAGEEGPPEYIYEALDDLKVERIDHGVRSEEDAALCARLAKEQMPLTVCPLSNVKLCVVNTAADHNIKRLLDKGMCVMVNSDDPAYFGGYIHENYRAITSGLNLSKQDIIKLAQNSIMASFMAPEQKAVWLDKIHDHAQGLGERVDDGLVESI